jgi:hypothetical protein
MSDPAPTAPAPQPAEGSPAPAARPRPPSPRPARWLDRLTSFLLAIGAGVALLAAAPSLLRASGMDLRGLEAPIADPAPPTAPGAEGPVEPKGSISFSDRPPRFAPPDDPPHLTELEKMYPDGMWPGQGTHAETPAGGARRKDPKDPAGPTTNARLGHARARLPLREKPEAASPATGELKAGDSVIVVREAGDWSLVVSNGGSEVHMGWAKRADVAVP